MTDLDPSGAATDRAQPDPAQPNRHQRQAEIAAALRLRADPPRVRRLSRAALAGLTVIGSATLGALLILALQSRERDRPPELFTTDRVPTADGILDLPRDYGEIPRLGPPLPGDLGRPILAAQQRGALLPPPGTDRAPEPDPAEDRRLQEIEAARTSSLFAPTATGRGEAGLIRVTSPEAATPDLAALTSPSPFPADPAAQSNPRDRATQFLAAGPGRAGESVSPDRLQPPPSPYILQAGAVIPAALITGLRSDLPGLIVAQVTEPVRDSPTGRHILIPQGARLIGEYDARPAQGQSRLLLVWTRLILPDGASIRLARLPGADQSGQSGLEDETDAHWDNLLAATALATLLNIGAELGATTDDPLTDALRDSTQSTIGRAGDAIVQRQLAIPPTLTIRPGFPVRVLVTQDIVLAPWLE